MNHQPAIGFFIVLVIMSATMFFQQSAIVADLVHNPSRFIDEL